ncbi:MAG: carboxypeptidase-like regulatory domain-containing protein, partial [Pedobacter sp.]
MKNLRLMAILAMLLPCVAMAQISVSGKITGSNQQALVGASIKIKNKSITVLSDNNGNYALNIAPGNYTLSVSFLGYKTEEKPINLTVNTTANFILTQQAFIADEVVVSATRASKNMATT